MSDHYHDAGDLELLREMRKLAPPEFEVVEASFLAAALRAGGAATHGAMALKFFDAAGSEE